MSTVYDVLDVFDVCDAFDVFDVFDVLGVFDVFDGRMQNCETRKDRKRKRHHTTSSVQPHAVFENRSNFVSAPCAIGVFNLSLGVLHTTGLAKSRQQFLIRILCSLHTPSSTKK